MGAKKRAQAEPAPTDCSAKKRPKTALACATKAEPATDEKLGVNSEFAASFQQHLDVVCGHPTFENIAQVLSLTSFDRNPGLPGLLPWRLEVPLSAMI